MIWYTVGNKAHEAKCPQATLHLLKRRHMWVKELRNNTEVDETGRVVNAPTLLLIKGPVVKVLIQHHQAEALAHRPHQDLVHKIASNGHVQKCFRW